MNLRHRHVVAVPLAVLVVVVSLLGGWHINRALGDVRLDDETILGGEGLREFDRGEYTITSWSGFFFAKESDEHLSVAALTSPVLVKTGSESVLIPVGWQWNTDASLTRIPHHFWETHLKKLPSYREAAILKSPLQVEEWLVASVHPALRDQAWVMQEPDDVNDEQAVLRLMTFPQSDTLPEGASAFSVERWGIGVRDFLQDADNPADFLNPLVLRIGTMIEWFHAQGYPERAERYQKVMEGIAEEFKVFLSEEAKMVLQELKSNPSRRSAGVMVRDPASSQKMLGRLEPSSAELLKVTPFDSDIVKQEVYLLLRDMGALFTINTEIIPIDASHAEVHAVVFGDHVFDFVLDISADVIDTIVMDGKLMAYPMEVGEFKRWVEVLE